WIDIQSEVGKGTFIRIYLPRVDVCALPDLARAAATKTLAASGTVLVVEDQEEVRRLTATVLKDHGYSVIEAANGAEALAFADGYSGEIHLLVTDVILPGMNGKEISERLRALRPGLKVLFTSGYTADVIARQGIRE